MLQQDDVRELRDTVPDADLWVRDRASPSAPERNVTERITGATDRYDIKDVNVSPDGRKFIFAMRGPLDMDQDEEEPPSWGIWEYNIATDVLRRVISSNTIADEGHDVAPAYLPDDRIVFSSTRQRQSQAILRDEGKPGYEAQTDTRNESAFVLHVMKADGTDIHQISFNQSHDLTPTVLQNGRLMWSRWDGATGRGIHLYTSNPDGTNLQLLYGARSHATGTQRLDHPVHGRPRDAGWPGDGAGAPVLGHRLRRRPDDDRRAHLRREHAAAGDQCRHDRPGADARHAQRRLDRRRPLARRPLRLGLSAVGRHQPHPGQLVAVPPAGHHRDAHGHRALHGPAPRGSRRGHGAAAVQRLHVRPRGQHIPAAVRRRSKAS